jgi:hypothetical protein
MAKNARAVAAVNGEERALACRRAELQQPRGVPIAPAEHPHPDRDDDQQAGELHAGEHHIELHAFTDAPEVDQGDEGHESEGDRREAGPLAD